MVGFFMLFTALLLVWVCSDQHRKRKYNFVGYARPEDLELRTYGATPSPPPPAETAYAPAQAAPGGSATAPSHAGPPRAAAGINMASLDGAFDMTEPGKEFMAAYNPTGLASVMPAGWKTPGQTCEQGGGAFAEFSRYSISPQAVSKSESMRSVMRMSENTRQGQGRTLGYQSLLRNYVTPIGPQPIGDKAMLWNDSSMRQSYIASTIGKFPELASC